MPIEIREMIIRATVEPDREQPPQPAAQPTEGDSKVSIDEDTLAQLLRDQKER